MYKYCACPKLWIRTYNIVLYLVFMGMWGSCGVGTAGCLWIGGCSAVATSEYLLETVLSMEPEDFCEEIRYYDD